MSHFAALTASTMAAASAAGAMAQFARRRIGGVEILSAPTKGTGLNVALFSGNYNCVCDGANRALNRLVAHMTAEGAQVRIYSPVVDEPAFQPTGQLVGVPSLSIPGRSEYRVALGLPQAVKTDLEAFAPDIIHVSAPDLLGRAAQRYASEHSTPVVASYHTRFETYFEYYGLGVLRYGVERWLRQFYARSDRILVPTSAVRDDMICWGLGERTRIWSRGVDGEMFSPALRDMGWRRSLGYRDTDVVPLFLGRLVLEKGLGYFVDAIARVREWGYRMRPLIVGDGPARSWLAERLPNAVFVGHLSGIELGMAVASADILLNPSLTEAFGNVTLEAMASGIAIVCPDVGSTRDLVRNEWSALMVEPNADAFAEALARLADDEPGRLAMGRAAHFASRAHSWPRINDAVVECYRELLAERMPEGARVRQSCGA